MRTRRVQFFFPAHCAKALYFTTGHGTPKLTIDADNEKTSWENIAFVKGRVCPSIGFEFVATKME